MSSGGAAGGPPDLDADGEEVDGGEGLIVWNGLVMRAEQADPGCVAPEPVAREGTDGACRSTDSGLTSFRV